MHVLLLTTWWQYMAICSRQLPLTITSKKTSPQLLMRENIKNDKEIILTAALQRSKAAKGTGSKCFNCGIFWQ